MTSGGWLNAVERIGNKVPNPTIMFVYLIAFIANLYALKVQDRFQNAAGLVYAGAAIGAVFAGDLFTLFVFCEVMTLSAAFLIMARRTERALAVGDTATLANTSPAAMGTNRTRSV